MMALTDVGIGKEKGRVEDNGFLKAVEPSLGVNNSMASANPTEKSYEEKDGLGYANVLRSRNKFVEALVIYESVLEKDNGNVEAHIGKGICLQMQNMGRRSFESFSEAVKLDPQNACALTHCGILYTDEGRLVEAAESYRKALEADSSYKPAAECMFIVLTDIGTSLKLAGNTQEGIQKYYDAIKIDPHYKSGDIGWVRDKKHTGSRDSYRLLLIDDACHCEKLVLPPWQLLRICMRVIDWYSARRHTTCSASSPQRYILV